MKAFLILEDGTVFTGTSIGSKREVISEIVFNTSMTGYLEVLTDPSYAGQAVAFLRGTRYSRYQWYRYESPNKNLKRKRYNERHDYNQ